MAGKNLLVNGKNNITARANAMANIQANMANRTTATNVNATPNLPTPTTNVALRKAAQPVQTPIVQNNAMNNLNTKIVQPAVQNTTAGGVGTVAPIPQQQSRFIGLQQQPTGKSMANLTKSALYIPTAGGAAGKANKKEENKFRTTEQALLDFQADVLKKKGKMKDADIKRLYPEFADRLDVMKELQTELRPIVKNGQGVDGEQLAQYYPELIQPKNLQDVEAIKKQSDTSNKKLQSNIQKVEKVVTENFDVLSPDGQKYVQDYLTLAGTIESLKKNYRIVGGANDDEILQYALENNPQLKGIADELQNLRLSELDKATIDGNSQSIITSLISGLQKMTRQASTAAQNFAAEQNYLAEQEGNNQPNVFNTTWNLGASILGEADKATTAGARFLGNQNVNYNVGDKEAQEAVEKQQISDMLAMGGGYWKTVWGLATAPFEYGKLNPITKPVVEGVVEPIFEGISTLEKTITNPVWNELGLSEQDKENADAILLGEIFRESKNVKKDIKVRTDAAKDIVTDAFKRTVKSNKRSEMKQAFQDAGIYNEAGYIKPEARTQAAKIIAREFAKDFTENFKNDAKQWGDVVDFYRKKEGVKSYKEQINDIKQGAKDVVDTVKEEGKKAGKTIAEGIDKGFDKMDESIETRIDKIRNKVTKEKKTEIKAEETAPIKDTAGWSQPKKGVVSKVVGGVTAVGNKINEKVVDPLSTKVAEGITSTTAPQDKLFKALNPSINVLSRKKGNYDTIRKNADRANELIVEYGDAPTNSKDYYDSIVSTKKKIWNNGIQQGLDEYKYTTIDAKDLINPVREALKEFTTEPLEALKGDVKKLEAELQAIESKGIISLLEMETKKRQINAILEYGLPPDASQIYEKGMRELNRQIGIQEDRMISELPGEFSKFKRDYGALTAIEEDAQKLMIKDMKKKLGGNLIQNWSRIEGLGKMGKAMVGNGSFLEGAAQIILGESLGKVKDTNFLIKSGFEGLRGQYKGGITNPEGVKIKKKPPTPRLEDKRTDVEKGKLLEIDKRTKANREEGYKTKNAVTSEKSAVTEKKSEPKAEVKKPEIKEEKKEEQPKQEIKNKVTAEKPVKKSEPKKKTNVEKFREETAKYYPDYQSIENGARDMAESILRDAGVDAEIVDLVFTGSKARGLEHDTSDFDILIELKGNDLREDTLFDILNDKELNDEYDFNPILADKTGTLEDVVLDQEKYMSNKRVIKEIADEYGIKWDKELADDAGNMHGELIKNFLDRTEGPIEFSTHGDGEVAGALDTKLYKQNPQNMSNTFYIGGVKRDMEFLKKIKRPETENSKAYAKLFEVKEEPKNVVTQKATVTAKKPAAKKTTTAKEQLQAIVNKYKDIQMDDFSDENSEGGGVNSQKFKNFAKELKKAYQAVATEDNMELTDYNVGYYNVTAFFKNNEGDTGQYYYVSLGDVRDPEWRKGVLYRTARDSKDYHGGSNQYTDLENLAEALKGNKSVASSRETNTKNFMANLQRDLDNSPIITMNNGKLNKVTAEDVVKKEEKSEGNAFGLKEQKGSSRINNFTNVVKKIIDKYSDDIEGDNLFIELGEPYLPLEIDYEAGKKQLIVRHPNLGYDDPAIRFTVGEDGKLQPTGIKQAFMEQMMDNWDWSPIKETDELLHTWAVNLEDQYLNERNIDEDTGIMKTTTEITGDKNAVTSKKVEKPENKGEQPAKSPVNELLEKNGELEYYIGDKFMTYRYPGKSLYTTEGNPIMEGENVRMIPITQGKEILEKQIEKAFDNGFKMQVTNGEEINGQIYDHIERFDGENGEPVIEFYRTAKHGDEFDYVGQYGLKEFLNEYGKDIKNLQTTKSETIQSKPKNLVTNRPVDNSSITGKFRNLTLDDYKKMQKYEGFEDYYLNESIDTIKKALSIQDTLEAMRFTREAKEGAYEWNNSDFNIEDYKIDILNKDVKKAIDNYIELYELSERVENGTYTKEDEKDYAHFIDDYDEKTKKPDWNDEYIIEETKDRIQDIFGGDVYNPFIEDFYREFGRQIKQNNHKDLEKDIRELKELVDKYGEYWNQGKSVVKSENRNIIGKNNSLTTKNNSNGQITNEQRLGQTNQPNGGELRNEVSNMQSVEGNKAGLQGGNNTNGDRQLTTSGEQANIRGDGLTAGHESTKLTVGQQRKVNEDTRAILEKHNFSTSRSDYTPEELETLFKYEGNGGLAKSGDENVKGTRYEYYTPKNAVQALQRGIQKYSDSPITSVEDPTAGKGNMLDGYGENVDKYMYEISPISGTIAKLRFPEAKVGIGEKDGDFQRRYLNYQGQKAYDTPRDGGHNVDAILLNAPFGKRITIKDEPQIKALEDYFTKRSIEHDLKDGGVVGLLMPSRWLKADDSYTKKRLDYNTKIMDAYRLPAGVFSYTDVGTDLIILKKVTGADNQGGFINDNYFKQNPDKVLGTEEVRSGRHGLETYIKGDAAVIDKLRQDTDIAPTPMNKVTGEGTKTAITTKTTTVENKPKNIVTSESFKPETATEKKATVEKKVPVKKGSKILKETVTKGDKTDVGTFTVNGNETAYKYQAATDADGFVDSRLSGVPVSAVMGGTDLLNYIDGKVQTDYLYFSGDIYAKLEQLEKDKDVLSPEQYQKQKDGLLNVLPEKLTVKDIQWSPSDKELMKQESDIANGTTGHRRRYGEYGGLTERNLTIKELFEDYLDALPREAFQGTDTSRSKIMDFVNGKAITFGQLRREYGESDLEFKQRQKAKKAENEIKRQATKERAKTFFNDFVNDSLSPEIQEKIAEGYNTRLRAVVKPDYKNMPLQLENMSATFKGGPLKLDPVQVEGINAMLSKGTMLIAHGVGYGKTLEGTCATIESIQRGRCKRPLFIVPNGTKKDWISTIHDAFPGQEIVDLGGLRVDDIKRLRKDLGNDTTQWIKDGQVGIITHSGFNGKLSFKKATQEDIQGDLRDVMGKQDSSAREEDALEENIQNIAETLNKKQETKKTSTAKALLSERYGDELLEQLDANMEDMNEAEFTKYFVELANGKYPENELIQDAQTMYLTKPVYVEDLGIDHITVDEVHKYKNIFTSAKLSKKGDKGKKGDEVNPYGQISGSSAPKSRKMFALSQYILKNNNGRGVFSLTATPFNNQPIEVYNMLSLHAYNRLVEKGIQNINSFFDMFANFRQEWISKPLKKGGGEFGLVMKDFSNLPEMQRLIGEYIDYVGDNPNLVRPEKRTKKVILTPSALQKQIQEMLQAKEAQISAGGGKETVLPLYSEMRQNIISPYITNYAQNALPTPTWKEFIDASPKLKFAVDTIKALRDEGRKDGVFIYMPKGVEFHNLLKQAIEESVGRDRVKVGIINGDTKGTVMVDGEPVEKDIAIADQFRNGELNVLIGGENTTEGINLQDNGFITINTLIGWNPTEITQLNGRVWRQGNLRDHVIELLPLLTDGGDIMMMQKYDEKSNRINNIFESQGRVFNLEEIDPEEEKMALMTDPKRKAELSVEIDKKRIDKEIQKLSSQNGTLKEIQQKMPKEEEVKALQEKIEKKQAELKELNDTMKTLNPENAAFGSLAVQADYVARDIKSDKEQLKKLEKNKARAESRMENYAIESIEGVNQRINENDAKMDELIETKKNIDSEMPDRIAKFTKEYEEWKANMKTPEEYIDDLKEDFRSLKVFENREQLKAHLDEKKTQKNNVIANDKNKVTTQAARTSRPSIRMNVEEREEKNSKNVVVNPDGKQVPTNNESKNGKKVVVDSKGKAYSFYHGTPNGGFEEFDMNSRGSANDLSSFGDFGKGFYFTPDRQEAINYATLNNKVEGKNPEVYEVKLYMNNPLDFRKYYDGKREIEAVYRKSVNRNGNYLGSLNEEEQAELDKVLNKYGFKDEEERDDFADLIDSLGDNWGDWDMSAHGYDGVIGVNGHGEERVVFDKNQIEIIKHEKQQLKNGATSNDKNRVTNNAARAYSPTIVMRLDENGNPIKKNKVTSKKPTQNAPMKFSPELVEKVDKLAEERGLEGNTIKKMKVLNKEVDKGKGYQTETEKEIYNLKKQIIIEYVKSKRRTIKDKGQKKTIVDIKQGKTRVHWHVVGKLYRDLKKEGIIK